MKQLTFEIYNKKSLEEAKEKIDKNISKKAPSGLSINLYFGDNNEDKAKEIIDDLKETYPNAIISGITSYAEIIDGRVTDPVIILSVKIFYTSYITQLSYKEYIGADTGRDIKNEIEKIPDVKAAEIFICNDKNGIKIIDILEELSNIDKKVVIFGAMPYCHTLTDTNRFIASKDIISYSGIIVNIYSGKDLYVTAGHVAGWRALGRGMEITKASGCVIKELDGKPAMNAYMHYLGIKDSDDFAKNTSEFPLYVRKKSQEMLRHPESVNEDGSINLDGYVKEGMTARISFGDPDMIVDAVNTRCVHMAGFMPEGISIYSCAARKIFWGAFINNELAPFEKIAPTSGFCTGGELSRDPSGEMLWHNITMVTVGFREGEKTKKIEEIPYVITGGEHGQTSLVKRLAKLVKATTEELEDMAVKDGLTKLYNRRKIEDIILNMWKTSDDTKRNSLIMLDIDYFKSINDTYGHDIGDIVLQKIAFIIKENATINNGCAGRWGGEEFFIVLPDINEDKVFQVAERIRQDIMTCYFENIKHVTVSEGVITTIGNIIDRQKEVYQNIDNALYTAKRTGRNKVISAITIM